MLDDRYLQTLGPIGQLFASAVDDHQLVVVFGQLGNLTAQLGTQLVLFQDFSAEFDDQDHSAFTASTKRSASRRVMIKGGIILRT